MKGKPQVHFWKEQIGPLRDQDEAGNYIGEMVYAVHACRAWDTACNGIFLLFTYTECFDRYTTKEYKPASKNWRELLREKLEARERALTNWFGRSAKHHLADFTLTPSERQTLTRQRESKASSA
jgi:hypothetical protein